MLIGSTSSIPMSRSLLFNDTRKRNTMPALRGHCYACRQRIAGLPVACARPQTGDVSKRNERTASGRPSVWEAPSHAHAPLTASHGCCVRATVGVAAEGGGAPVGRRGVRVHHPRLKFSSASFDLRRRHDSVRRLSAASVQRPIAGVEQAYAISSYQRLTSDTYAQF